MTKVEAIEKGLDKYMRGTPCRKGHVGFRSTRTDACLHCKKNTVNRYRKKPGIRERENQYGKDYRSRRQDDLEYKEQRNLRMRESRKRHPNTRKRWRQNNRARDLANEHARRRRNPQKFIEYQKTRSERVKRATPSWLSEEHQYQMILVYEERDNRNLEGDTVWEVDHVVPIQGKKVCGLHVPWNLQVSPRSENRSKSNYFNTSDGQFQEFIQSDDATFCVTHKPHRLSRY